jgi:plasmid stabilization system protein ParE
VAIRRKTYKVVWDVAAQTQLKELIEALAERYSSRFINHIKEEIEKHTRYISRRPKMFPIDVLKMDNDGCYRYFNVPALRIAYKIEFSLIIVLRVRHQSQEPLEY